MPKRAILIRPDEGLYEAVAGYAAQHSLSMAGAATALIQLGIGGGIPCLVPNLPPKVRSAGPKPNSAAFEAFWRAYPRKVAKVAARKAWEAAMRQSTAEAVMAALAAYKWPFDGQYIPHAATWLRREEFAPPLEAAAPPPPEEPDSPLWKMLRNRVTSSEWRQWLADCAAEFREDRIVLRASSAWRRDYIREHLLPKLAGADSREWVVLAPGGGAWA